MKHIDKKTMVQLQELLEAEQKVLQAELSDIGVQNPATGDWQAVPVQTDGDAESDYTDQADYVEDFESRSARLNELEHHYHDIVDALEKMKNGTYGICEKSGKPIELDRLMANPAARTCKEMMNL
jgi:RNA polymerase-binding transcription factor DksA